MIFETEVSRISDLMIRCCGFIRAVHPMPQPFSSKIRSVILIPTMLIPTVYIATQMHRPFDEPVWWDLVMNFHVRKRMATWTTIGRMPPRFVRPLIKLYLYVCIYVYMWDEATEIMRPLKGFLTITPNYLTTF